MATIVIAARARARGHEAGLARDQVLVPMPDTDLVRHGGTLEKEAERDGRKHWRSMYCVLTEEILGIRRSEGVAMIDWIPLEEIVSVALAGMEPDMLAAAPQEPAKSTRRFWRGGKARKSASPPARGASSPASSPAGVSPSPEGAFPAPLIKQQNECEQTTPSGCLATGAHNSIRILRITTMAGGRNGGRDYVFRAPSPGLAAEWCQMIRELSRAATDRSNSANRRSLLKQLQLKARWLHGNSAYRLFFGMLILASYILSISVAEIRPPIGSHLEHQFDAVDDVITSLFAVEVAVALTGFWLREFLRDPWMVFDLVVVSTSIASATTNGLPALYSLRSIRVLRAVKLLKIGPLRVIVQAMLSSVIPVANSFVLLGLIVTIYTTMAVNFFGGIRCAEEDGRRGLCDAPGQEPNPYFYKFSVALLSMFQVMTGDAWATEVMKSTMPEGTLDPTAVIFFVSFMLVGNLVLINIVIAVLLDEFLTTLSRSRDETSRAAGLERSIAESHVLDPMLEVLSQYRSRADLRQSIVALFERMDSDASGYVGFEEMTQMFSMQQMNIYFSQEDWDEICVQHIANQDGLPRNGLSPSEFEKMIMHQLKLYHFRHINRAIVGGENTDNISLLVLKWMLTREEERDAIRGVAINPFTPLTPMVHGGGLWADRRIHQTKRSSPLGNGPLSGSSAELTQGSIAELGQETRQDQSRKEPLTNSIALTGVFQKRGHINTAWQQRFFVLHKRAISYFASQDEYEKRYPAKGVVLCTRDDACVGIENQAKDEKGFCFKVVQSTGKELICKTNSQKQRDTWVREIQAAIQGHYLQGEVGAHVPEEAVEQNQAGPVWTVPVPKRNTVAIVQEKEASPKHRPAGSPLVPSPDWNAKLFLEIETSAVDAPTPVPSWGMPPPEMAVRLDKMEGLLEDMNVKLAQVTRTRTQIWSPNTYYRVLTFGSCRSGAGMQFKRV
jgi:voltage-gated sodium channel